MRLRGMRLRGMRLRGMRLRGMRRVGLLPRLRHLWADSAYGGKLIGWVAAFAGWVLEVVRRTDQQHGPTARTNSTDQQKEVKGFVLLPRRWVVERTFGWLTKFRRLVRDYEETTPSSEAWVRLAMINVMVRRLAPAR